MTAGNAGQAVEDALFGKGRFNGCKVEVRDIDLAANAVGFGDQRVDLANSACKLAVNENVGAAAGMVASGSSRFATVFSGPWGRSKRASSASISPFIVKKFSCSP